jgi:hypothetical protein
MRFDMKRMPRLVLRQMCRSMMAPKLNGMAQTLKRLLADGAQNAAAEPGGPNVARASA